MSKNLAAAALSVAMLLSAPLSALSSELMTGQVAKQNVQNLTRQVEWCTSLSQAESAAARQGKMVFWMHMLGSISGAT